ncbi:MAG: hypothetical protein M1156_01640 [Candidatus Marsarchaeota archaeon]|jgi:hypothetical protein|nr:hypothetical protein [Candidatus Marsarchaeota archaeon]
MPSKKKIIKIGAALIVVVLAFIIIIYVVLTNALNNIRPAAPIINSNISVYGAVINRGIATYSQATGLVQFAQFNYQLSNATAANLTLDMFSKNPIFRIYLVNSTYSCYKCLNYSSLYSSLYSRLNQYGLVRNSSSFQGINLRDINSTVNDSVIILPTGLIPASLMPDTGLAPPPGYPNTSILTLLARGDYIVYVGYNFSHAVQASEVYTMPNTTLAALATANLNTVPYYKTSNSSLYFKKPTFEFSNGTMHGPLSYAYSYNGTFIALSNYPSLIWNSTNYAANDISKIIASRFWMSVIAYGTYAINNSYLPTGPSLNTKGNVTMLTTNLIINNTPSAPAEINNSYSLISVNASNTDTWLDRQFPFRTNFNANGTLDLPSVIGYGIKAPVQIKVNPILSKTAFSIDVLNRSLEYTYGLPLGVFNTTLPTVEYYLFGNLPTGQYYIASLIDITGRHYGYALFYVPDLNITLTVSNFKTDVFLFNVLSDGQELSNVSYAATINGTYNESGTIHNGVINYTLPNGAVIGYGLHNLSIHVLNREYIIPAYYQSPPAIPSLYIEFGIAGIVILLLNIFLRAPNRDEYYIDLPESPPVKMDNVNVTSDQIVNLFDAINYSHYWKYMPLTPDEVKFGVSSVIHVNNTPVSITLQNMNEILYTLVSTNKLSSVADYYMPKRWELTSKHDVEYLVIFRRLRDYLVKHAAIFTDLDQSNEADMVFTAKDKQTQLFIFSSISGIRKMKILPGRKAFIVFLNSEARSAFVDKLYKTYGKAAELTRLSIESGSIVLVDTNNLREIIP